ncbi:PilZ domain-containing protein [Malonomonas rubra]|uniref:PilZ domain-containing protein n=1 Tax=Malonomonas rubra TaxID=57040 RepID=UPI0026EEC574|nr:PilZ domain-containing protein [Malonomonas rubra]
MVRSTILDISESGCALLTNQEWNIGDIVGLRFIEFEDQTSIWAKVLRWTRSGTPKAIPLIGVCFKTLREEQLGHFSHLGNAIYQKNKQTD